LQRTSTAFSIAKSTQEAYRWLSEYRTWYPGTETSTNTSSPAITYQASHGIPNDIETPNVHTEKGDNSNKICCYTMPCEWLEYCVVAIDAIHDKFDVTSAIHCIKHSHTKNLDV
jgi:hypothetical protein